MTVHEDDHPRRGAGPDLPGPLVQFHMTQGGDIVDSGPETTRVAEVLRANGLRVSAGWTPRRPPEPRGLVSHHQGARRRPGESNLDAAERVLSQPGIDSFPHDPTPDLCWRCDRRGKVNHLGACGPCRDAMRRPGFLVDFASGLARLIERNRP